MGNEGFAESRRNVASGVPLRSVAMSKTAFDFYREQYFFELERRYRMDGHFGVSVSVQVAVGTALAYLISLLPGTWSPSRGLWTYVSVVLVVATAVAWCASLGMLMKAYWHHTWGYLPKAANIRKKELQLLASHRQDVDAAFVNMIIPLLCEASDYNRAVNTKRVLKLRRANKWVLLAAVLAGLGYIVISLAF